jgi:SPP1 family phage portal protein
MIPAEQAVPIWEDRAHRRLSGLINYYYMTEYDLETGEQTDVLKVECWHPDGVVFYTEYDGKLVEDIGRMFPDLKEREIPETGLPHFVINGKPMSWGMVPFIPFRNNSQELSDLRFVRSQIDAYDKGVSDLANVLEELRKLVLVLKNYQGTDLSVFMDNLRYYGAVKVDEDGGVDKLDLTFNADGSNSYLDRLKKDIYQFGQGVNMDTDNFGQNPSGVALEFLYSGLKLKTDNLERKFKAAFSQLFRLACVYLESIGEGTYEWRIAKVTFNRSIVSNVMEQIEAVASSAGLISKKTAISKHPWVDDVDQELEQLAEDDALQLDRVPMIDDPDEGGEDGDDGGGDA